MWRQSNDKHRRMTASRRMPPTYAPCNGVMGTTPPAMGSENQRLRAANNLQEPFLRTLADTLHRELKAQQVILFGSHTRG